MKVRARDRADAAGRRRLIPARLLAVAALCLGAGGCPSPRAFLISGDASSAEIGYGGDLATAFAVARQHCAEYEKAARLLDHKTDIAFFDCVRR